jgi:putative redox protein
MDEDTGQSLNDSLAGYKEKILPANKGSLEWDKDLIFNARTQMGYEVEFDARMQWGCAPTETLLMSLAGCMAIDVFSFLQKMRVEISSFKIDFSGERNPDPPQYYKSIDMVINIAGKGATPKKLDRAISLSQEKYCSVYHSLRKDIDFTVSYNINNEEG